jgi:glycolate oxidase FAD binding subunit
VTLETRHEDPWAEAARALALAMPPVALETTSDGRVLARLAGTADGVGRIAGELGWTEVGAEAWDEHARRAGEAWARISVPPGRLRSVVDGLPAGATWWASPGVGIAHWTGELEAGAVRAAREAAEDAGGSLVLLSAPPELKREVGAWGTAPATATWMSRLRDAFDPQRTISPGRYVI